MDETQRKLLGEEGHLPLGQGHVPTQIMSIVKPGQTKPGAKYT